MKFEVFKEGRLFRDFVLRGAYLFGSDGIATRRAQINFSDGVIYCRKPTLETSGLALLWEIPGYGKVLLPTTCLPEREKPYNLNVELARAKLMQIINKREDWAFFTNSDGFGEISRQAHELFINAVQVSADTSASSRLADESLARAITYAEKLAIKQAQAVFKRRIQNRGFGRGCLGCRLDTEKVKNKVYLKRMQELFGFVFIPVNWKMMEPKKGAYDFSSVDKCVKALAGKRLLLGAGPLLRFEPKFLPDWIVDGTGNFEKVRERAYQFIVKLVKRYAEKVHMWIVVGGLNVHNHFSFTFEQILEMTRAATMAVKAAAERSLKVIEISNPWGEYYADKPNTVPPLVYMDMIVQSGISFEAFGLRTSIDGSQTGLFVRDIMQTSALLDYFGMTGKPLYITEAEVPGEPDENSKDNPYFDTEKKWDHGQQAQWLERLYRIALSKPFIDTVIYSTLADGAEGDIANRGLLDPGFEPKESYRMLKKLQLEIFKT